MYEADVIAVLNAAMLLHIAAAADEEPAPLLFAALPYADALRKRLARFVEVKPLIDWASQCLLSANLFRRQALERELQKIQILLQR